VKIKLLNNINKDEKTMVISSPTSFVHTLHVHLNPISGEFIVYKLFLFFCILMLIFLVLKM
jgi:hypothetical protein